MKGVSPLVAAVLIIAFTVSVSMIVMGWFSTFIRGTTANVSGTTQEALACQVASINIEHVYASGNTATIVVKNTGFTDLNVTGLLVNTTGGTCTFSTTEVPKGSVKSLQNTSCSILPNCNAFDRAVVTTNCGGVSDTVTSLSYVTVGGTSCA